MYCKYCGNEIEDNSSFCKHCGKATNGSNSKLLSKPGWVVYLIWTISNLYLLMGEKLEKASEYFYPFTFSSYYGNKHYNWDKYFYDFSEFIVYVFILPVICYIVYRRYNKPINKFINKLLNKGQ